jgi:fructokinase
VITVVGESIADLVVSAHGDTVAYPGGSPANVAVGLGRLGSPVSLLTRFGRDRYGAMFEDHFAGSAVRLLGDPGEAAATSTAVVRTDGSGVPAYEFTVAWDLPWPPGPEVVPAESFCLHTGSIAAVVEPGAGTVRRLLDGARGRATVSYDPNCRPSLMGRPQEARSRIEALVGIADVVKVSDEDLGWLHPGRDHAAVADEWLARGPALVVVTCGGAGSYGVCRAGHR